MYAMNQTSSQGKTEGRQPPLVKMELERKKAELWNGELEKDNLINRKSKLNQISVIGFIKFVFIGSNSLSLEIRKDNRDRDQHQPSQGFFYFLLYLSSFLSLYRGKIMGEKTCVC